IKGCNHDKAQALSRCVSNVSFSREVGRSPQIMKNRCITAGTILLVLFCCHALSSVVHAQFLVKNNYVAAIVEPQTGWITIRKSPGTLQDPILSYPQKSFLSIMIGDKIYTNNNVGVNIGTDPRLGGMLQNGVN